MRVIVTNKSLRRLLRWSQVGLFAGAAVALGYCASVLVESRVFQELENRSFERLIQEQHITTRGSLHFQPPTTPPVFSTNGLIGRIEIPRLGLSVMILEGDNGKILRRAAGHVPGTALPGHRGNVGITAHRDTFFRPLRNIRLDDMITLATLEGEYHYRVVSTRIVTPDNVSVLNPDGEETLTLVTCYPFYFVGAAPSRFIVRAERAERLDRNDGILVHTGYER